MEIASPTEGDVPTYSESDGKFHNQPQTGGGGGGGSHTQDQTIFVSTQGSDVSNGLSWQTAKLSIQAAITALGGAGTIYVGAGTYDPFSLVSQAGITIQGSGAAPYWNSGTIIQADAVDANCITIDGSIGNVIRGLGTKAFSSSWTGCGISITNGSKSNAVYDWQHDSIGTPTSSTGGDGLYIGLGAESHLFVNTAFGRCRNGIHMVEECVGVVFIQTTWSVCYRDLYMDGTNFEGGYGPGGNTFIRGKGVACAGPQSIFLERHNPGDPPYQRGTGGGNLFISCDWDESGPNTFDVDTMANTFVNCVNSPASTLNVTNDFNIFQGHNSLGAKNVTGNDGKFVDCWGFETSSTVISGTGWTIDNCRSPMPWCVLTKGQIGRSGNTFRRPAKLVVPWAETIATGWDMRAAERFSVTTTVATAFKIDNPGRDDYGDGNWGRVEGPFVWEIINDSGGAIAGLTWGTGFVFVGGTPPDPPADGERLEVGFWCDGTTSYERYRTLTGV